MKRDSSNNIRGKKMVIKKGEQKNSGVENNKVKQAKILEHSETHSSECCHIRDHKHKLLFACAAIILVIMCAVGEYLFSGKKRSEISENNAVVQERRESIKNFEREINALNNKFLRLKQELKRAYDKKDGRKKWKVWIALKNKLESGEPFEEESEIFNKTFSYDGELLKLVKETVNEFEMKNRKGENAIIDTVKKYVNKVVSVKKIDPSKLLEISGYVITSIERLNEQ